MQHEVSLVKSCNWEWSNCTRLQVGNVFSKCSIGMFHEFVVDVCEWRSASKDRVDGAEASLKGVERSDGVEISVGIV